MDELIFKSTDLYHLPGEFLGKTNALENENPIVDNRPVHVKQYRYPPVHKQEIDRQIKELLDLNVISPSTSPYNSPMWIVPKKPDSKK